MRKTAVHPFGDQIVVGSNDEKISTVLILSMCGGYHGAV